MTCRMKLPFSYAKEGYIQMSRKDTVTKDYMKDTKVFADAFNLLIYGGRQVIDPDKLHEMDTTALSLPYGTEGAAVPVQRYRDELKYLTAMEDETAAYLILGIENQSGIHYAMPVKDMLYDSLQYADQVNQAAKSYRSARKKKKEDTEELGKERTEEGGKPEIQVSSEEFLSGLRKGDRLLPVITLVVHFGAEEWDGPVSLHQMLAVQDERILAFVPDYRINLLSPASMSDEEIKKLRTSLREVMLYVKYSNDKEKLVSLIQTDDRFQTVERKAAEVMSTVTGSELKIREEEESVNMCEAIKGIREEGRREGRQEGRQEGRREGRQEGERIGREQSTLEAIKKMMKTLNITAERAMEILEIPGSDYPKYLSGLEK